MATIALKWTEGVTDCFIMLMAPDQKYSITGKTQQGSALEEKPPSWASKDSHVFSEDKEAIEFMCGRLQVQA